MLQHEPLVSTILRNGRAMHCLFHHISTRIPRIGHWEEIPTCLTRTQGWPSRGSGHTARAVLHLLSAQQKEISPFQTCSCAAAEGDLATEHPSCHQITTHLGKIQTRRKAERRGTGVRIGWSSSPVCAAGQMEFVMFCFCCARAMWNFPLPEKGNGRKMKENKQENKPLQGACCCCRKNRYQIKNLCLKTVHMPAPGDFKYLWFATFLIFKISRDAVSRTGCKLIPCLTWMWLVTCNCSGGKGTAASLKGSWGSYLAWWGFSLCPRRKFGNFSSCTDSGTALPQLFHPRQCSQHTGRGSHHRQGGAEERWCPGEMVPTATTPGHLILPLSQWQRRAPFYSMA